MYGQDYLDWRDKQAVAAKIDAFMADMPAEDRVWALAILRERHTVYKDGPQLFGDGRLHALSAFQQQQQLANHRQNCLPSNGPLGSIAGALGL